MYAHHDVPSLLCDLTQVSLRACHANYHFSEPCVQRIGAGLPSESHILLIVVLNLIDFDCMIGPETSILCPNVCGACPCTSAEHTRPYIHKAKISCGPDCGHLLPCDLNSSE
jgi:hypothetical protein